MGKVFCALDDSFCLRCMASGINIYSFFSDIQKIILDSRKKICDIWNTGTLISDI